MMGDDAVKARLVEHLTRFRYDVTNWCAGAIENVIIGESYLLGNSDFKNGYRQAQRDFSEMLRGVANGKITVETVTRMLEPKEPAP